MEKKKKAMMKSKEKTKEIPDELLEDILLRLPTKSLVRLNSVSKAWHTLVITDSTFINRHLNRVVQQNNYSLVISDRYKILCTIDEPTPTTLSSSSSSSSSAFTYHEDWNFKVMGSCDGLLLLVPAKGFLRIWNPSTRDFIDVPPPRPSLHNLGCALYGFGCDSNRNDYKIVAIIKVSKVEQVKIFSMSSCSWGWRTIENLNTSDLFHRVEFFDLDGKFASGAAHWLGYYEFYNNATHIRDKGWRIIAFDFGCEEFRVIPPPQQLGKDFGLHRLSVWNESIYFFIFKDWDEYSSDVYVMKEYGARDSWCKLYTIPEKLAMGPSCHQLWRMVCFTDDGKILLQGFLKDLAIYDPKSGLAKIDNYDGYLKRVLDKGVRYVHAYVSSLVPIRHNYHRREIKC